MVGAYNASRRKRLDAALVARPPERRLEEAVGLAEAIGVEIVHCEWYVQSAVKPATYIGSGRIDELSARIKADDVEVVIVDAALSPTQQRNLERALHAKVLDRTGLILEIFGERARTREGTLQVEHAHLSYQRSRLVRSWTHLERQRGGLGFVGGPGETQIESDRRMLQERIARIERELDKVKRTRGLHRQRRQRTNTPVAALVGYTNAGKSTLFNALSGANVLAKDLLFATLDPTARQMSLASGLDIVLSDTVGFISELPTTLVAAFRATLEEVTEADLILHIHDAADPDVAVQSRDVENVLRKLDIDPETDERIIDVWNKVDALAIDERNDLTNRINRDRGFAVSALKGTGLTELLTGIDAILNSGVHAVRISIGPTQGSAIGWLYEMAKVLERTDKDDGTIIFEAEIADDRLPAFQDKFPSAIVERAA